MKILNFGSINIDYVYRVSDIVKPGETISSNSLEIFPGGKGLNQSIALARAGAEVHHAGNIGSDGYFLKDVCEHAGVGTEYICETDDRTGNAIIQLSDSGQNSIILYPGANRCNTKEYIDKVFGNFDSEDMLLLQNEVNLVEYMIEKAHSKGMDIAINPSPYDDFILKCDLSKITYFFINEIEGLQISGQVLPAQIADSIVKKYPDSHVVLTLGEAGVYYRHRKEILQQEAMKVKPVDTTAAGDTFTGYFIASVIRGEKAESALQIATKAAAITVQSVGASSSIPYLEMVLNAKF